MPRKPSPKKSPKRTKATSEGIAPTVMVSDEPKRKGSAGRPSDYTEEKAIEICSWIAGGKSLNSYCSQCGKPNITTVYRWLTQQEIFRKNYARAREDQADSHADEIIDIADTEPDANKARVRIDARKWVASKLKPRKYGETTQRVEVGKPGEFAALEELTDAELTAIATGRGNGAPSPEDGETRALSVQ